MKQLSKPSQRSQPSTIPCVGTGKRPSDRVSVCAQRIASSSLCTMKRVLIRVAIQNSHASSQSREYMPVQAKL